MKKVMIWVLIAISSAAMAGNKLLLDMESVASLTSKNAKFHGGEFGEGAPLGYSVGNGNRSYIGGGAGDGIELSGKVISMKEGSISLYFKISKSVAKGKAVCLFNALGMAPYYNNFGLSIVCQGPETANISFTLVGAKGQKKPARSVVIKNIFLEREKFHHLAVNWRNLNSGKADGSAEVYLNGKLIGKRQKSIINVNDIGKKFFVGSCDLEHGKNSCGNQAFALDEVEICDTALTPGEVRSKAAQLPFDDMADGRILPWMPVKGGGKRQFKAVDIPKFPIQAGAVFCRFRVDEIIPGKSIVLFDNTGSPAWHNRIALMLKMFENNVVEFYFVVSGARTKIYTSKVARKTMPLDPTRSHTVLVKWKNINSGTSNGVMEIFVNGVNVAGLNGFLARFDKVSNIFRIGGGVPPSGVFARKDLLTIEECRIWRNDVPNGVMRELFNQKSQQNVEAAIKLPVWQGTFKNDGKIDRMFWLTAADFGNFHGFRNKGVLENSTQVKAAVDDKNLYVMWKARYPEASPRGKKHDMRDAALWRQDSLELHFDTAKGKASILISAFGEIYDSLNKFPTWNSAVKTAVGRIKNERIWTGTAVVPLSEITNDKKLIKGTVCRNISGLQDSSSSWKVPYGQSGNWQIGTNIVVSNIAMPDMVSVGNNQLQLSLAALDGKTHNVTVVMNIKNKGKDYVTTLRRGLRLRDLEIPMTFNVPFEGRCGYFLTVTDENNDTIWSNQGVMDVKPQLMLTLFSEFYKNKLNVTVNAENIKPLPTRGFARILKDGKAVSKTTTFKLNKGVQKIAVDTSSMDQHAEYTLELTAVDPAGKKSVRTEKFEFAPKPSGYPLNAGSKTYFGDFWFTPKFEDGTVKCWNRVYKWQNSIFPVSIISAGKEMLAQTPYFEYRINGKIMRLSKAEVKFIGGDEEKSIFEVKAADGNLSIYARVRVEYDGLIGYDWTIAPETGRKIDKLSMVVPVRRDTVHAKLQGLETTYSPQRNQLKNYPPEGRAFRFSHKAGLGGYDRGIFLAWGSDENWLPYDRNNVEEIVPDGDKVWWRWNIVDGAELKRIPKQQMGFQITPYKPLKKDQLQSYRIMQVYPGGILRPSDVPYKLETLPRFKKLGVNILIMHLNWSKYTGGYEPDDRERFRKFVQEAHKLGMRVLVYRASITNEYEPSFLYYNDLWVSKPRGSFFGNPVNPKYKLSSTGRCTNAPGYIDWYVGMAAKLIKDYDVDGFYYDFGLGGCNNALHGCGYVGQNTTAAVGEATGTIGVNISSVTAEDRERRPTFAVFKQRELWKRMYNMVKELKGEAGLIDAHTSAPDRVFSYPFVDSMYHSESAATHKGMFIDPEMYRIYFSKQSLGTRGELIFYIRRGDKPYQKIRKTLALTLLHREIYRPMTGRFEYPYNDHKTLHSVLLWKIFQKNKVDDAQWLPYYENKEYVTLENGNKNTLASLWRHDDRLLLVVSNLGTEPCSLTVKFHGKCRNFKRAINAETTNLRKKKPEVYSISNDSFKFEAAPENFKIFEIVR